MKTIKIMALLLVLSLGASFLGVVPFPSSDISKLTIVELLCFADAAQGVAVTTEDGMTATGASVSDALRLLKAAAPGKLLLGTVDHITICGVAPRASELLACGLRPAAKVYRAPSSLNPEAAAEYFRNHEGGVSLGELAEGSEPPLLSCINGRPYSEGNP